MYLFKTELQALFCLLAEIVNADGIISDNENRYTSSLMNDYGFSRADMISAQQMDIHVALRMVREMEDQKKALFYRIFQKMEHIDGSPFPQTIEATNQITIKARLLESEKLFGDKWID